MYSPHQTPTAVRLAAALAAVLMTSLLALSQIGLAQHYAPAEPAMASQPNATERAAQSPRLNHAAEDPT